MKSFLAFILLTFSTLFSNGQNNNSELFKKYEDSLITLGQQIVNGKNAMERQIAIYHFRNILLRSLKTEGSFQYSFDSLVYISILKSDDERFRIFNWYLLKDDNTYRHFGIIHLKTDRGYKLIELEDCSDEVYKPEDTILTECWYGAHYYNLITCKKKKNKYYLFLGFDGNNPSSNKKIVDVLSFNNDSPEFGKNVFKLSDATVKYRHVFEYKKDVVMSLKYYTKKQIIVYDHLSPNQIENEGLYMFYGPDMSYEGLKYKRGKWFLKKDLFLNNDDKSYQR